ncbi:GDSL-type esterase/lipase family protein [Convivina intestini]|uniref:GDSL-type esterase/lipase family protein n=1 Tax=Convivina intestini TaxID=1505726 RepID=UPI00200C8A44|nr:GDSL-type esterase/lipase family protein [Convivina intestini]CAH1850315.1 hypothetical protein R078131_00065 [Convivina intestini]
MHKKMYKVGKSWAVAAVIVGSAIILCHKKVFADQVNPGVYPQAVVVNQHQTASYNSSTAIVAHPVNSQTDLGLSSSRQDALNRFLEQKANGYLYAPEISQANGGYVWFQDGVPYTGFQNYAGAYYWFQDGIRQDNGWHDAWNLKYYTGEDGRTVQGLQNISGARYYFGEDSSYFLRTNQEIKIENSTYRAGADGVLKTSNGYSYDGKKDQLWGFGDSTTVGYNEESNHQSFDVYAAKDLNVAYNGSLGISGTTIQRDMGWMTDKMVNDPQFYQATDIVVGLGVNDVFGGNENLNTVAQIFRDNLLKMHLANPMARIYIMLPQGFYRENNNNDTISAGSYSLNQLIQVERQIGNSMGIPVVDGDVINDNNHTRTMPDGMHPSSAAYAAIGHHLAQQMNFHRQVEIRPDATNYQLNDLNGYQNTLSGYRWLQNGVPYTGFQFYTGAYYWFDKGIRQDNSWHEAWGMTYYTGSDGRAVEGLQNINGSWYYFGNNGSYSLKTNQKLDINGEHYYSDQRGVIHSFSGNVNISNNAQVSLSHGYLYDGNTLNGGYRWYEDGQLYTGFRFYMGAYYWFQDGVRQNNSWHEAWGMKYHTGDDGRAQENIQNINGKVYYFGNDGTFYLRTNQVVSLNKQQYHTDNNGQLAPWQGYIRNDSGSYRWYEDGQLFTGFRYYEGAYYWFTDGVRQDNSWHDLWGKRYYTGSDGRAVQGNQDIDGRNFNFGSDGTYYLR